jgi:CHAT domain-containing protein/Flp pilus assembly protein TadD
VGRGTTITDDHEILDALKYGSKEEVGKAITLLSRLKDPKYIGDLKKVMCSDDATLGVMAAYALAETGDKDGADFIENILHSNPTMFVPPENMPDAESLQELLSICDDLHVTFDLYNKTYLIETKNKVIKILKTIYDNPLVATGVKHFDDMLKFTFKRSRGMFLDMLAICELHLGNIESALNYSIEAISIAEELGEAKLLKLAYSDLGQIHIFLGNYYSALELLHKSLEIDAGSHDPWRKRNRTLSNLSHLYYQIGRYDKALEYGREALELSRTENDLNGVARCLNALGVVSSTLNEIQDAENYLQEALQLATDELNNKSLQGLILNNLALVYFSGEEIEKAKEILSDALDLAIQMSDKSAEGTIRSNMAMLELEEGNIDNARFQAEAALEIYGKIYSTAGQSDAQYLLGSIEDLFNDATFPAYQHYREAIRLSETLRENLLLDDFKISFAENHVALYQQMISLCIRMGKTEEAFEYIERSKSRAFVDMLSSSSNSIGAKELTSEEIAEVANLRGNLDLLRMQIAASYLDVNRNGSDVRREDIVTEISDLEEAYLKTFENIKTKDPEWVSLVSVGVADIEAVQRGLDEKTVLLEFYQTGSSLFVVVIRKNTLPSSVNIPMDVEPESERLFDVFTALSAGSGIDMRSHEFIKDVKKPLSYFHDLLISPLHDLIEGAEHLIIVPHYFWHYLPFHALYDSETKEYLIDKFSISYAPSATALNLCSRKKKQYKTALILANPSNDLPYADEEGERISSRFGENGHLFKRELASIDRLSEYGDVDVIHLACHGYFRGDEPLFSHIVLKDSGGETFPVFLPDIYNLRLSASLVTLSACETGLSHFTVGDELIGLSRAFFYAGTPALLTSLWTVNDKSTAFLMERFYDGLVDKDESNAEALRTAMLELKAMREYSHPYFWAPFFLSGGRQ